MGTMLRTYRGKVAVVTGAAQGLGRALAGELGARGCHLALVDIDDVALAKAKEKITRPGIVVTQHCADIAIDEDVRRVAPRLRKFIALHTCW